MEKNKDLTGKFKVKKQHLAVEIGSGTIPVLGTPALIGFMENIASDLVQKDLDPHFTSVGIHLDMEHLRPSAIKSLIEIKAKIISKTEKIVKLDIEAFDKEKLVGKASHKRAIINRKEFETKYNIIKK